MAGKKRRTNDDVIVSKTAKRSKGKMKDERAFIPSGDVKSRIIPLCAGEYAYVLHPVTGHTHHLKVDSEQYRELVETLGLS